jgi:hypothetical protein
MVEMGNDDIFFWMYTFDHIKKDHTIDTSADGEDDGIIWRDMR